MPEALLPDSSGYCGAGDGFRQGGQKFERKDVLPGQSGSVWRRNDFTKVLIAAV